MIARDVSDGLSARGGRRWRVLLDPGGHSFAICIRSELGRADPAVRPASVTPAQAAGRRS